MVNKSKNSLSKEVKDIKSVEILKKSLSLYKKKFWTLFVISLIPSLFYFLIIELYGYYLSSPSEYITRLTGGKIFNFDLLISTIIYILVFVVDFVLYNWGRVSLLDTISKDKNNIKEAYQKNWKKILPFCFISIVYFLICIFGTILLIIPGILFSIWFNLCFWIYIDQNIKGIKALKLSHEYMKGNVDYYLRKLFFITFMTSVPVMILQNILKIVDTPQVIRILISNLGTALIQPITVIYSLFVYKHIKSTKTLDRT